MAPEEATATAEPTPTPARLLTVCLGQEPASLFLYADTSSAARSVRQAIYDGPFDPRGFVQQPVILERLPDLANGDARLEAMQVMSNTLVMDSQGALVNLVEGVSFRPAGCTRPDCAQTYSGGGEVVMDQLAVRFKLRPGLLWSDGTPLTAKDSLYAYEVARLLYPRVRPDLLDSTYSYQALDDNTIEWRGMPGALDPAYQTNFFTPLPQHAWGSVAPADLLTSELPNRMPLGWGPYLINEWTPGDHITLSKNPNYFRNQEGLPYFDRLVYRFVGTGEAALSALLAGECDFLDETAMSEVPKERLLQLQGEGQVKVVAEPGTAWEHADFNLSPVDPEKPNLFQSRETRQAIAMCIDRGALAERIFYGKAVELNTYLPPSHPLYNQSAPAYAYDPQAAGELLTSAGWIDSDGQPGTARISQGVPGVPDGTSLSFTYQTLGGGERQQVAERIRTGLAQCGIQVNLEYGEREALFAPGPEGPIFGRSYAMAQFGWPIAAQPACSLYTTGEIPGPSPQSIKGWGGANATGYSNPAFDSACQLGRLSLPDYPEYAEAHSQAQAIFVEDLPVIPLYVHLTWAAMRPDLCGVDLGSPVENGLWNLEIWDYGNNVSCE